MKNRIDFLVLNIPAMICFLAAAGLAFNSLSGRGWFLFGGLLITHVMKSKDKDEQMG